MNQTKFLERKVVYTQLTIPNYYNLTGNIISNDWYAQFTNSRGKPDLSLITVLSEIVYWYRPKKVKDTQTGNVTYVHKFLGDAWQTSYTHFEKKFGFNREKIRRIFVKLEQIGICYRELRNIKLRGQTYNNRLFIHLNDQFLNAYTNNKKCTTLKSHEKSVKSEFSKHKKEGGYPHFRGNYLIDKENKNNILENRSTESNFYQNPFKKHHPIKTVTRFNHNKIKELKDFYPLSKKDCYKLQSLSGRCFSLNSMNEILLDMSKRLTDRYFKSRKAFLSYMGKAFYHEKRDAVKINNDNYKIRNNLNLKKIEAEEREIYLSKIEKKTQDSQQEILKRKLATCLLPETAYCLLQAYKTTAIRNSVFYLYLSAHVKITVIEERQMLQEIRSIYEQVHITDKEPVYIQELQIIMPPKSPTVVIDQNKINKILLPPGIWGRVRQKLIESYGEAIDRNWFSKLTVNVDEERKEIKLKAPTNFIKDWIQVHYFYFIEKVINSKHFKVSLY